MVIGILLTAMLATNAALFVHARRRNQRMIQDRMDRALRMYGNQAPQNFRAERYGK
jgi:hypothetical protein